MVGLEVHSPEEGKSVEWLGTPRKCCALSPPMQSSAHPQLRAPNLGELARPSQHEAGQFLVLRTFSFGQDPRQEAKVRHMGPLRNANAGLKGNGEPR